MGCKVSLPVVHGAVRWNGPLRGPIFLQRRPQASTRLHKIRLEPRRTHTSQPLPSLSTPRRPALSLPPASPWRCPPVPSAAPPPAPPAGRRRRRRTARRRTATGRTARCCTAASAARRWRPCLRGCRGQEPGRHFTLAFMRCVCRANAATGCRDRKRDFLTSFLQWLRHQILLRRLQSSEKSGCSGLLTGEAGGGAWFHLSHERGAHGWRVYACVTMECVRAVGRTGCAAVQMHGRVVSITRVAMRGAACYACAWYQMGARGRGQVPAMPVGCEPPPDATNSY